MTVSLIRATLADYREEAFDRLINGKDTKGKFKNAEGITIAKAIENASRKSDGLSAGRSLDEVKKLFNLN